MEKSYIWLKLGVIAYLITATLFVNFFKPIEFVYKLLIFSFVNVLLYLLGVWLRNKPFVTGKRVQFILAITASIYLLSYYAYSNREMAVLRALEKRVNHYLYLEDEDDWANLKCIVEKDNNAHKFYDISYTSETSVFSFYDGNDLLFSYPTRRESGFGRYRSISIAPESSPSGITGIFFGKKGASVERDGDFLQIPVIYR